MNTMLERILELMNQKQIKAVNLASAINVNTSTISRVLKGSQTPNAETLYKLAQYFQVSMEYLLTGADKSCASATFCNNDSKLLEYYHGMSEEDKDELMTIAKMKYDRLKRAELQKIKLSHSSPKANTEIA